jgi:6-phosphogluconolactonase
MIEQLSRTVLYLFFVILSSAGFVSAEDKLDSGKYFVFVGTYTGGESEGIYVCELDLATGSLKKIGVRDGVVNPSFLALHPTRKFLYSVSEISDFDGNKTGGVSAFSINTKTGSLTLLNQQSSVGTGPCHLVVDKPGKNVLVANYGGGSVACLPIGPDGRLAKASSFIQHTGSSVNPQRQKAPHAHSINLDPGNRFAFAADLGLDKILIYRFDASKGMLTPNDPAFVKVAPGAGPRHFAFHPRGKFAYVINEINLTVTAFAYDAQRGALKSMQTISTLPSDITDTHGFSTAEVRVHPTGKFLYGSNRGHDSIVVFSIDKKTGRLTHVENQPTGGKNPRNFAIDPTGAFLLAENQSSGSIVVLKVDPTSGKLTETGSILAIPSPVCIKFARKAD